MNKILQLTEINSFFVKTAGIKELKTTAHS